MRPIDGREKLVMKRPVGDKGKISFPGRLAVTERADGVKLVYPESEVRPEFNLLEIVYDLNGVRPELTRDSFDDIRERLAREWKALPKKADTMTPELWELIEKTTAAM